MTTANLPKRTWRKWLIVGLAAILIGYTLYQTRDIIRGPVLIVDSPAAGASVSQPLIEVRGQARRIAYLFLNGRAIFTDQTGHFAEKLLLPPGYTIISLEARDKFGRAVKQTIPITYQSYGEKN